MNYLAASWEVSGIQNTGDRRNTNRNIAVSIFLTSNFWIPTTRNIKQFLRRAVSCGEFNPRKINTTAGRSEINFPDSNNQKWGKDQHSRLALYFFSTNKSAQDKVLDQISFGGGCINDTLVHLSSVHLPFGGVGPSGMGSYHGKTGFEIFSHKKSILKKTALFDVKIRYAPYTERKLGIVRKLLG